MKNSSKMVLENKLRKMVREIISEVKTAWAGRLNNLDKILSQNYHNMKPADQNIKDTLFRAYYRYYNDGDVIAFPLGMLRKIGAPSEVISSFDKDKYGERPTTGIRWIKKHDPYNKNKSPHIEAYEQAMEGAILATFKYFKQKYPQFFNAEGRQNTIRNWKAEIIKYAHKNPTELSAYWVADFGKQFGKPELAKYNPHSGENKGKHTITDPDEISDILRIMLKSAK